MATQQRPGEFIVLQEREQERDDDTYSDWQTRDDAINHATNLRAAGFKGALVLSEREVWESNHDDGSTFFEVSDDWSEGEDF